MKTMHNVSNVQKFVELNATITNYNLWTVARANLKSLVHAVMEIWAKYTWIAHTEVFQKTQWNIATYVAGMSYVYVHDTYSLR